MPIKLIPPAKTGTPYYYGRGTHIGTFVNKSTRATRAKIAKGIIQTWERDIERGLFKEAPSLTFTDAAVAYMDAGHDRRPVAKLIAHFLDEPLRPRDLPQDMTLAQHWQNKINHAAATLFPARTNATRNREVHTPVSAILHHAGIDITVKRPKGWRSKRSTTWLRPEQAFAVFDAADAIDLEFGLLLYLLCYTGMRLGEALNITMADISLREQTIFLPDTKNGDPRIVYLPMHLIVAFANQPPRETIVRPQGGGPQHEDVGVPFMERDPRRRLFRFTASGPLRDMIAETFKACELSFPRRQGGFHIFCRTYATWMNRYGDLDADGLVRTGRWRDRNIAFDYTQTEPGAEAKRADLLPKAKKVENG